MGKWRDADGHLFFIKVIGTTDDDDDDKWGILGKEAGGMKGCKIV